MWSAWWRHYRIQPDQFEAKLPAWLERTRPEYPEPQPLAEWCIEVENKGGVPFVKSLTPKARIIHLFWKHHPKGLRVHGMRLRPDRLVFHLCRELNDPHSFEELMPALERWLPQWAEHFGVPALDGISLEYVNRLNAEITPQFINQKGNLMIGEALTFFGTFPGPAKRIINPYDCKVRLVMDEEKPIYFDIHVYADDAPNGVRVDFSVTNFPLTKKLSVPDAIAELRRGHELMLEQFACIFTDHAKDSFKMK